MGFGPSLHGAGADAGSGARPRAGAAARGVRPPGDAGRGGQGVRPPGPPVFRAVTPRRRALPPGGDPARAAGQSGGGAGRIPALIGSRSTLRSGAAAPRRSLLEVGDLDVVSELANDLDAVPLSAEQEPDLVVRLAIATTTLRGGATSRFPFTPALALRGRARDRRGGRPSGAHRQQPRHRGAGFDADARPDLGRAATAKRRCTRR